MDCKGITVDHKALWENDEQNNTGCHNNSCNSVNKVKYPADLNRAASSAFIGMNSIEHEKAYSHPCDKINIDDKIGTELYKTGQQCRPEKQQNKPSVSDPADTMLINKPVTEKKGSPYHTYTGRNIEPESYNIQRSTQKSSDKNKTKIGLI